ncbi:MAG: N-acetyltransferase [Dehalococcoidia bacterium]|nr:N-acetyltransferase [Dehalococcoidia bacterium]
MIIRNETADDIDAIAVLAEAASEGHPFSRQTEQFIVDALRTANALTISLVADVGGKVVGHVAFSPVTITDGSAGWYGVGPLSVLPGLHRQGVDSALMHEGLSLLKATVAKGCALVGDPDHYVRFGFKSYQELVHEGIPHEYVLVLLFGDNSRRGTLVFHEGFSATEWHC